MDTTHVIAATTTAAGAFVIAFHSVGAFLAIVLPPSIIFVSSLIVGLTEYPTTRSVLDMILRGLNLISFLTHSNSPDTWKPPLTQSKPPEDQTAPPKPKVSGPPPGSAAVVVLMGALMMVGCAHVPPAVSQLLQCGEKAISDQAAALANQAQAILTSDNPKWQDALDELLATAGDAAICEVGQLVNDWQHRDGMSTAQQAAIVRGEVWLRGQNKVPVYNAPVALVPARAQAN